jgi:hypothetical protein
MCRHMDFGEGVLGRGTEDGFDMTVLDGLSELLGDALEGGGRVSFRRGLPERNALGGLWPVCAVG